MKRGTLDILRRASREHEGPPSATAAGPGVSPPEATDAAPTNPDDPLEQALLSAELARRDGRWGEAAAHLQKFIEQRPEHRDAQVAREELFGLLLARGAQAEALEVLLGLLRRAAPPEGEPGPPAGEYFHLALPHVVGLLGAEGRLDEAARWARALQDRALPRELLAIASQIAPFDAELASGLRWLAEERHRQAVEANLEGVTAGLSGLFRRPPRSPSPEALRASLRPDSELRGLSCGEVTTTEEIDPEQAPDEGPRAPTRGGPRCPRVFGPEHDLRCACGRLAGVERLGERCLRCGVECSLAAERSLRCGHIALVTPVVHPWWLRSPRGEERGLLALLLGAPQQELSALLRGERWMKIPVLLLDPRRRRNPYWRPISIYDRVSSGGFLLEHQLEDPDVVGEDRVDSGVQALFEVLRLETSDGLLAAIERELEVARPAWRRELLERQRSAALLLAQAKLDPKDVLLTTLLVLPPALELRPGVRVEEALVGAYNDVISANLLLKNHLLALTAAGEGWPQERATYLALTQELQRRVNDLFDLAQRLLTGG